MPRSDACVLHPDVTIPSVWFTLTQAAHIGPAEATSGCVGAELLATLEFYFLPSLTLWLPGLSCPPTDSFSFSFINSFPPLLPFKMLPLPCILPSVLFSSPIFSQDAKQQSCFASEKCRVVRRNAAALGLTSGLGLCWREASDHLWSWITCGLSDMQISEKTAALSVYILLNILISLSLLTLLFVSLPPVVRSEFSTSS